MGSSTRLLAATFLILAACASRGPSAAVITLVGGAEAVSVLSDGTSSVRREAFRIDGMGERADLPPGKGIHGYPILSGPVPVDAATAAELAAILLDEDTYDWDRAKGCEFAPGVAIRTTRGATELDVLLCFSCDEVAFYVNGTRRGVEDTDTRRGDLLRIAKRLFPDDPKISALK